MHLASLPLYVWAQLGFEKLIYTWFTVVTSTVLKHTCSTHWSCLQFKYRALLKDKLKKKKKNTKLRNHEKLLFMSNSQCYECLIVHLPFFFFSYVVIYFPDGHFTCAGVQPLSSKYSEHETEQLAHGYYLFNPWLSLMVCELTVNWNWTEFF